MSDKMNINLFVGGIHVSLNISLAEEELVRAAAKQVDIKYNELRGISSEISPIRAMTMAAVQFAVNYLEAKKNEDTKPYVDRIDEMGDLLEKYIHENE